LGERVCRLASGVKRLGEFLRVGLTVVVGLGPDQSAKVADGLRDVSQQGAERSSHVTVVQHAPTLRVRLDVGEQAVERAECEGRVFERMQPAAEAWCAGDGVNRARIEPATAR